MSSTEPREPYVYQPEPVTSPLAPRLWGVAGPGAENLSGRRYTREEAEAIVANLKERWRRMNWPGQRRALFAAGRAHGLDIDELRALTPAGSISALTRQQAADLLTRLNGDRARLAAPPAPRRRPRLAPGCVRTVSDAQRTYIADLRTEIRARYHWTDAELDAWLDRRHYRDTGRPMSRVLDGKDAAAVIRLLQMFLRNAARSARRPPRDITHLPEVTSHAT